MNLLEKFIEIRDKFKETDKNYWDYLNQFSSRFFNSQKILNQNEI